VCDDMKGCLSLYSELDGLDASQVFLNRWVGLIRTSVVLSRRGQQEEMEIRELHLLWTVGSARVDCHRWMGYFYMGGELTKREKTIITLIISPIYK
jgi:hypothetical protein